MESFPSITEAAIGSWLRICLIESKDRIILSKGPSFPRCRQSDTDLDLFGTTL